MSWDIDRIREIGNNTAEEVKLYLTDNDGWHTSKKKGTTLIEYKTSVIEGNTHGHLYRGQCELACSKEIAFRYIDPSEAGSSLRTKWDKDAKELISLIRVDKNLSVIRCKTNSAAMGLISPRDFIDVVFITENEGCLSCNAASIEDSQYPEDPKFVRGWNYPSGIICLDIPGKPNHTKVMTFFQTDIKGALPRSLVDSVIPGSMVDFFGNLAAILKKDGHIKK